MSSYIRSAASLRQPSPVAKWLTPWRCARRWSLQLREWVGGQNPRSNVGKPVVALVHRLADFLGLVHRLQVEFAEAFVDAVAGDRDRSLDGAAAGEVVEMFLDRVDFGACCGGNLLLLPRGASRHGSSRVRRRHGRRIGGQSPGAAMPTRADRAGAERVAAAPAAAPG
jgi:hypothetical protein